MWFRREPTSFEVQAPAKLNLFLEVLGKRPDGYHELETLMVPVDICDTLVFTAVEHEGIEFNTHWAPGWEAWAKAEVAALREPPLAELPPAEENLAYRALRLLQTRCPMRRGARVKLIKRIPAAAGLGGASSDAAAALQAGNWIWKLQLSRAELAELAAELGSDVPFFLQGGAAVCKGRGESISPLTVASPLAVVVVRPPVGLSTALVYRRCHPATKPRRASALVNALAHGSLPALRNAMFNRLEAAARELTPWIERVAKEFARLGCGAHQMTGSGSSYFGVCRSRREAARLARQLRARKLGSVYCAATIPGTGREFMPTIA